MHLIMVTGTFCCFVGSGEDGCVNANNPWKDGWMDEYGDLTISLSSVLMSQNFFKCSSN